MADPSSVEVAPGHSGVVTISSTVVGGIAEIIGFDRERAAIECHAQLRSAFGASRFADDIDDRGEQ